MIDIETGHLLIDNKRSVTVETSLEMLEAMQLGESQKIRNMGNGWIWLDIKNLNIDDLHLNISFLFLGERIRGFSFVFQNEPYDLNLGWDSWSREAEEMLLVRFNEWLDEKFSGNRKFQWGKVKAAYDHKGGFSSIQLRYNRPTRRTFLETSDV